MAEKNVLLKDKFLLTTTEAVKYFGIGKNKLMELLNQNEDLFVLYNGNRRMVKRTNVENFLLTERSI